MIGEWIAVEKSKGIFSIARKRIDLALGKVGLFGGQNG